MEPLNLMVARKLVADDVRANANGQAGSARGQRGRADRYGVWSALWRRVTRRSAQAEPRHAAPAERCGGCPQVVSESFGD